MKIFVSSLISGLESLRDAAASAIATLGHVPTRAEDFPASPDSPRTACLAGVRASDAVVLLMGERYGQVQSSGLSATHEEYREAREIRSVLVFVEEGMSPQPRQAEFIREVQGWEKGHYTASFADATDLRDRVTRALHDFTLTSAAAPLNEAELVARARALIPSRQQSNQASLLVVVAPGPTRAVLRPAELEAQGLRRFLLAESLTGDEAVLAAYSGTSETIRGDALELRQVQPERLVRLDESGCVLVARRATGDDRRPSGLPSIIEDDITAMIERVLRFTARVLDHIDAATRLTHVAPVVAMLGVGYLPWRTREEEQRDPSRASISMRGDRDAVVILTPPVRRRPALVHDTHGLAVDFTVRLRREIRG